MVMHIHAKSHRQGLPGGPVAKNPPSQMQKAWVQSLVKELDPTYRN